MGFRFRKSFKVMPGVRMTVSPRGVSTSFGVRGAHVTYGANGRMTRTIGLPGTGLSYSETLASGRPVARSSRSSSPRPTRPPSAPAAPALPKPGMFAPKWEKELYAAVTAQNWADLQRIGTSYPEALPLAVTLDALANLANQDPAHLPHLADLLRWSWAKAGRIEDHPFVQKYLNAGSVVVINIATGVHATLPICHDAIGLALGEVEQLLGNTRAAITVVEGVEPSVIAAVSLADLYLAVQNYDEIIKISNGVTNVDDPTALLVTFRGIAFREQGMNTSAIVSFREALKSINRDPAIRHRALVERALTHRNEGRKAQARKDLERVLAEDSDYPDIRDLIAQLS